jgi:succinate dehydrogenase / fumarate reductase cytochrome b subunit
METYKTVIMGIGELGLVAAILFHALNGVRIILIDFWRKGAKLQNTMFWIVIALAAVLFAGSAVRQISHLLNY